MSEDSVETGESQKEYPTERLIAEADAFLGVPSHVAAGALHGAKKNLTVNEAKDMCKSWLKTEV